MASPNPFIAGPTRDEHDADPVEYVHDLKHADVPVDPDEVVGTPSGYYAGCITLDDHLARWWESTSWYDVLHPAGWTRNRTDECGCPTWTRPHAPGESVTPKSLTAHDTGCSRGRTDDRHPAGHVWSDHVDGALADMVTAQGRTLSAFAVYTALQHDGDYGEACRAAGIPTGYAPDLTAQGFSGDNLAVDRAERQDGRRHGIEGAVEFERNRRRAREIVDREEQQARADALIAEEGRGPWELQPVVGLGVTKAMPGLCYRTDGVGLLYPGRTHDVHALAGTGKSWFALWAVASVLLDGGYALYLDYESDPEEIGDRLQALGVSAEVLNARLGYRRVRTHPTTYPEQFAAILDERDWSLAIIDGVNNACAVGGFNTDKADDINRWNEELPLQITRRTGAAVLMVDHLPKGRDGDFTHAIGSQSKRANVSGASFALREGGAPLLPGRVGHLQLYVTKDRNGAVATQGVAPAKFGDLTRYLGLFTLDATDEDDLTASIEPPEDMDQTGGEHDPQGITEVDMYLDTLDKDYLPSATEQCAAVCEAIGGENGLTESQLLKEWQRIAPQHCPAHSRKAFNRACASGLLKRSQRTNGRFVVDPEHKQAQSSKVRNLVGKIGRTTPV